MTKPDSSPEKQSGPSQSAEITRRQFHRQAAATAAAGSLISPAIMAADPAESVGGDAVLVDDFQRDDTFYHGDGWESLNPGYWKIEDKVNAQKVLKVACAAYLISLSASANRGINERCQSSTENRSDRIVQSR